VVAADEVTDEADELQFTVGLDVPRELVVLAHDPQTSGGLLAAIPRGAVESVETALAAAGVDHWRVGAVQASNSPSIALV